MVAQLHGMGAVVLNTTAIPSANISYTSSVIGQSYRHDDKEFSSIRATTGSSPTLTFSCPVGVALSTIGLRVLQLTGLDFYLTKYTNGVRDSSSQKYSLSAGASAFAVITGFSSGQGGIVSANVSIGILSSDGSTDPVTAGTGSIPAITEPLLHTLGETLFNNSAIDGVQSVDFSLSQRWAPFVADGDFYAQVGSYDGGEPTITVSHGDPVSVMGSDFAGVNIGSTTSFTMLAIDPVTHVPTTTNEIVVTVGEGRIIPQGISASVGSLATGGFQVVCLSDTASVHPWVVS